MAKIYKTEDGVFRLLETRYTPDKHALFRQVADSTGYGQKRYADAIAFGLWPSRGLEIEGFEIKVSRSDWLNELKNHAKSADIQAYCHRWWIVVGDKSIVKPDELPSTWGLLAPRGADKIFAKVKAPLLKPKKLSRKFCAAVMRRAAEGYRKNESKVYRGLYERAKEDAEKRAVSMAKFELERENAGALRKLRDLQIRHDALQRRVNRYDDIEKEIGFSIANWDFKRALENLGINQAEIQAAKIEASVKNMRGALSIIEEASARAEAVANLFRAAGVKPSEGD